MQTRLTIGYARAWEMAARPRSYYATYLFASRSQDRFMKVNPKAGVGDAKTLHVALLEDDDVLRDRVLLPGLLRHGFDVTPLRTIAALTEAMRSTLFDLVMLDIGLPDGDGFTLTQQLQNAVIQPGIVILSGRGDAPDRVRGLNEGADAYLVKPVEIEMLAATLFSVARRLRRSAFPGGEWLLQDDGWCLFAPHGEAIALTASERRVLQQLWECRGQLVAKNALLSALSGDLGSEVDPHRLDALLHRLRQKVQQRVGIPFPLKSVRGEGYLLTVTAS